MNKSEINILLSSKEYRKKRRYWVETLSQVNECTLLKEYGKEYDRLNKEYKSIATRCTKELEDRIQKISNGNQMSVYIMFLTSLKILLHRYTALEQLVILAPIHKDCPNDLSFNSLIPICDHIKQNQSFKELLFQQRNKTVEAYENQTYPMERIFEQLADESKPELTTLSNVVCAMPSLQKAFPYCCDFNFSLEEEKGSYVISLTYNEKACDSEFASALLSHLENTFSMCLMKPDIKVGEIDYLSEKEKDFWRTQYNLEVCSVKDSIIGLIEEQVTKTPNEIAICDSNRSYTYHEMNARVNQLAHYLSNQGVGKGQTVALIMDNSIEVVVCMLAVLKTGATYLPINHSFPLTRIQYMIEQSEAEYIITDQSYEDHRRKVYDIHNEEVFEGQSVENLETKIELDDLAYLIFTSGSTGKPKGAMIKHRGLTNYITWAKKMYVDGTTKNFPLYSSISFDLTVTSIYTPLISGGKIVVYSGTDKATLVKKIIEDNQVNIMKLTPAHLSIMEELDCSICNIKKFIVGGENLKSELVARVIDRFQKEIDIFNEYGPTEATVGCMIYRYDKTVNVKGSVPIGVPAQNTRMYLLDEYGSFVPFGVLGEIYIAGEGVAKGYINNEDGTNERFLTDKTYHNCPIYRTGDYAFMHSNGQMEFVGRKDNQVKIKGFRIEFGEIENTILSLPVVNHCVVRTLKGANEQDVLIAFVILNKDYTAKQFRDSLQTLLPDYMIPVHFYKVDAIPVNQNGKVDVKELENHMVDLEEKNEYVAPSNELENMLVEIYETVLGIHPIGVKDDFFILGGDSIKAIRVAASLYKKNYQIGIEDIFSHPEIQTLSKYLRKSQLKEKECTGEVELSPIQHYFFDLDLKNPNCYYQSMVLYSQKGFEEEYVRLALNELVILHDSFRLRYHVVENKMKQTYEKAEGAFVLTVNEISSKELEESVNEIAKDLTHQLDLENGPLMACSIQKTEKGDHLFIVVHHLIMDGVSFRILIEDFDEFYTKFSHKEEIEIAIKTNSYQTWSSWVNQYANEDARSFELDYWKRKLRISEQLFDTSCNKNIEYEQVSFELSEQDTKEILTRVHQAYGTEIHAFLVCAFSLAIKEVCKKDIVSFMAEGHGREKVGEQMNVSRTIGWFTSMYPVILNLSQAYSLQDTIRLVKESLAQIPNKGFDYSVLKYCRKGLQQQEPSFKKKFEILFNYLGDISNEVVRENFQQSRLRIEGNMDVAEESLYAIEVNGVTNQNKMQFKAKYNQSYFSDPSIPIQIMEKFREKLIELMNHCKDICNNSSPNMVNTSQNIDEMNQIESLINDIDFDDEQ